MLEKEKPRPTGQGGSGADTQSVQTGFYHHEDPVGYRARHDFWLQRQNFVFAFVALITPGVAKEDLLEEADGTGSQLRQIAIDFGGIRCLTE